MARARTAKPEPERSPALNNDLKTGGANHVQRQRTVIRTGAFGPAGDGPERASREPRRGCARGAIERGTKSRARGSPRAGPARRGDTAEARSARQGPPCRVAGETPGAAL